MMIVKALRVAETQAAEYAGKAPPGRWRRPATQPDTLSDTYQNSPRSACGTCTGSYISCSKQLTQDARSRSLNVPHRPSAMSSAPPADPAPTSTGATARGRWADPLTWLLIWAILGTVGRVLLSGAVTWDQAEQLIWIQTIQWGYGAQPPLYTWIQWLVSAALGPSVLSLAVVKHALMALTFVFLYLAAREIMPRRAAWLASLGTFWLPGMGWQVLRDQTHTVLLTCMVAATWWLLLRQIRSPSRCGFALLGAVMAAGVLSKYSYVLFAGAAALAALSLPEARRALLGRGWWWAPALALLLIAPHAAWIWSHWDDATRSTLTKLRPPHEGALRALLGGLEDWLKVLIGAALPWALMAWWALGAPAWRGVSVAAPARPTPDWPARLLVRYLLIVVAALLAMVLFAGVSRLEGRWVHPLVLIAPMAAFAWWPALGEQPRGQRRYLIAVGVMAGLLWLVNWSDSWLDAARGHADRFNWPVGQIEAQLRAAGYDGKAPIIANRHIGGGLLRSRFPEAHVTVCDIERWDAELCVQDTTHHARQQGRRWWLVAVEDAPSAGWWDAAEPADGPAATPHSVALPFRFSHDGKPTLSLQYLAQADSVRTPKQ